MMSLLREPWPWYVAGPLIGLCVPALLIIGNKPLGVSSSLRAICAAVVPGSNEFLRYDWKATAGWNVVFAIGILLGAALAVAILGTSPPDISADTRAAIAALGLSDPIVALVPSEIFTWQTLLSIRGLVFVVGGGFLVGFGASYAGGCTSGHGISGLAALQLASVIALVGIFAGGLVATFFLIPLIL